VRKERAEVAWGKKEHVKSCGLEKCRGAGKIGARGEKWRGEVKKKEYGERCCGGQEGAPGE
jgi:hypothetical protein